jgi:hypothetical protein
MEHRRNSSANGWSLEKTVTKLSLLPRFANWPILSIPPANDTTIQYSTNYLGQDRTDVAQKVHYVGNGSKSLKISLRDSLRKLRTDYVDILYVHWWDYETSIEEVMNSLHNLVAEGKVLYLVC